MDIFFINFMLSNLAIDILTSLYTCITKASSMNIGTSFINTKKSTLSCKMIVYFIIGSVLFIIYIWQKTNHKFKHRKTNYIVYKVIY